MADIYDVEQAVADTVTSILYPGGASQSSIIGALCRVYRGWPNAATLNTDLSAGTVNVTVCTDNDSGRTTTRYLPHWQTGSEQPGTVVSAIEQEIAVSGSPAAGDVVGAIIDGVPYAYRIQAGDSVDLVASGLGRSIQRKRPARVRETTVFVPGAASITVRAVCDQAASFESRRQEKDLRIICWCPAPLVRDAVTSAIDAAIDRMSFLKLPDATQARILYRNTASYDQSQNALLYRRDLIYAVEYPTIAIFRQPSMLFGVLDLNSNITYG
jgi:hypothetical protein